MSLLGIAVNILRGFQKSPISSHLQPRAKLLLLVELFCLSGGWGCIYPDHTFILVNRPSVNS